MVAVGPGVSVSQVLPASGELTIGRLDESAITIAHASVSRTHAVLRIQDGGMTIEDLGSANGTRVSGHPIASGAPTVVAAGATLQFGDVLASLHGPLAIRNTAASPPSGDAVGADMQRVLDLADLVAKSKLNVILLGETGVGKEVLAHRIHAASARSAAPFVKVNCAAFADSLTRE